MNEEENLYSDELEQNSSDLNLKLGKKLPSHKFSEQLGNLGSIKGRNAGYEAAANSLKKINEREAQKSKNNSLQKNNEVQPKEASNPAVKQRREMANNSQQNGKNRAFQRQKNKMAFKENIRNKAAMLGGGTGAISDALLETKYRPALEEAANAPEEITAKSKGQEKLIEMLAVGEFKKYIFLIVGSFSLMFLLMLFVLIILTSKWSDSQAYSKGDFGGTTVGIEAVDSKYTKFYENVEKYASSTDKYMVIAVLTANTDNDVYSSDEANDDGNCSEEEINNGTCVELTEDGVTKYSKSKMKKYIKKVSQAIQDSGSIAEGDYENRDSGSDFFWWLYDEFIEEYYNDSKEIPDFRKKEMIHFIYLYYKDIKQNSTLNGYCSVGGEEVRLTIFDDANVGAPIDKAKVKVKENGWKFYEYEGKDYLAVATATNICIDTGCGKIGPESDVKNYTRYDYITYYNYMDTFTLTIDGKMYDAIVVDSCGGCQWSQEVRGDATPNRIDIWTTDSTKTIPDYGTLNSSNCAITGDQILLGNQGIYSTSIFPVGTELKNVYLTQGYRYDGGGSHGAIDLFCARDNAKSQNITDLREFCTSLPIVAAHYGTVISVVKNQNCANSKYANLDTTLPVTSTCSGNSVIIQIQDKKDPFYGYKFNYWHMDSIDPNIQIGTKVATGQVLGQMGSTGNSTGWHLHFAIVNPKGQKLNQNDNILKFVATHGLYNDGIRATNEGPKF